MKRLITLAMLFGSFSLNAQTVWNSGSSTFTKTAVGQQDCINASACLTRGATGQLYNTVTETGPTPFDCSWTPGNTEWAYGSINNWNTLTYQNLFDLNTCDPPSMVNQPMVLHIISTNTYLQLTFSYWQQGGGNFTYTRTTQTSLPVELLSFEANAQKNNVLLNWETATERNNQGFYIQRGTDGKNFENIAYISSAKANSDFNQQYSFADDNAAAGANYYRLKIMDINGGYEFSKTLDVTVLSHRTISISPNPATDNITISGYDNENVQVQIRNNVGTLIRSEKLTSPRVDITSLPAGLYFMHINDGKNINVHSFVKQ